MNIAIIPARAGSKGLKGKNTYPLWGKPLIRYTIEAALQCEFIDKRVVTTDSRDIYDYAYGLGCEVVWRTPDLATDEVHLAPVIIHALEKVEEKNGLTYDHIVTLQPTSPLRNSEHLRQAWIKYKKSRADSLLSVVPEDHTIWQLRDGFLSLLSGRCANRQWCTPDYVANGAIFITKRDILLRERNRIGGKVAPFIMTREDSIDIHTIDDIRLAEFYLNRRNK